MDGTGLGEGNTQGATDVSAQIDNEDQLMGALQKDRQEQQPSSTQQDNTHTDAGSAQVLATGHHSLHHSLQA